MDFGLQTQPKSWFTGYTFWVNHYLEIVFSKISVVNPPPPPLNHLTFSQLKFQGRISLSERMRTISLNHPTTVLVEGDEGEDNYDEV